MGTIAVRYQNAEHMDPIVKAKNDLPETGIIKMTIYEDPEFKVKYEKVDSAFLDIRKSFAGKKKNIDLSDMGI